MADLCKVARTPLPTNELGHSLTPIHTEDKFGLPEPHTPPFGYIENTNYDCVNHSKGSRQTARHAGAAINLTGFLGGFIDAFLGSFGVKNNAIIITFGCLSHVHAIKLVKVLLFIRANATDQCTVARSFKPALQRYVSLTGSLSLSSKETSYSANWGKSS